MKNPVTEFVGQESKPCEQCGAPIVSPPRQPSRIKNRRYCSRACDKAAQRAKGAERFWSKVDKNGPNGCWIYTGFKKWDGYGWVARSDGKRVRYMTAHRYSWILTNGEPPEGMHILHQCDNPPCCNPAHLRLGTHSDNMKDMHAKGRYRPGRLAADQSPVYPTRVRPRRQA